MSKETPGYFAENARLARIAEILDLEDGCDELNGEFNEWASVQREVLIGRVIDPERWA